MTTMILPFFWFANNKINSIGNITKLTKKRRLNFYDHDEVGANIIALDLPKRKLWYTKKTSATSTCLIIDLNKVESCTIKKEYGSIEAGELNTKKLHHFLKSIFLNLVFKNCSRTVSLPLFDAKKEQHSKHNVEQLEAQAKKWQLIVSKQLPIQIKERA